MANLKVVTVTAGVPTAGSGTVSTLDGAVSWTAGSGVGLAWVAAGTTYDAISPATLNGIVNGNAILSDIAINNSTALDRYMDISITLGSIVTPNTAGLNISLHLYPLNVDGTTYGDGRFGTSAAGPPNYPAVAAIPLVINVTQAQTGTALGVVIPPGTFKLVFCNNAGVNLNASATLNTCKYRTYN